jgi:polysaccharide pyruvyl transferase WcaK-like protein
MSLTLFDPAILDEQGNASKNLGDLIISKAVKRELKLLFPDSEIQSLHTHTPIKTEILKAACKNEFLFVGGTNLLGTRHQWKLSPLQSFIISRAILLGVGWMSDETSSSKLLYKLFLKNLLSSRSIHSVRDNHTKRKLESLGIKKVINTSCPTMWPFAEIDSKSHIPSSKSQNVLFTLTDYRKSQALDIQLFELLKENYEKTFFWPQGSRDLSYIKKIGADVHIIGTNIQDFENFVCSDLKFDYVGTRLHAGIYCLLHRRRSLIIEVDNRAREIAKDTGLPTCSRSDFEAIRAWINSSCATRIQMDEAAIKEWRSQFMGNQR